MGKLVQRDRDKKESDTEIDGKKEWKREENLGSS